MKGLEHNMGPNKKGTKWGQISRTQNRSKLRGHKGPTWLGGYIVGQKQGNIIGGIKVNEVELRDRLGGKVG